MVVVVGGSGFIGSRLCAKLEKANIEYKIIDKQPSPFFNDRVSIADIRNLVEIESGINTGDVIINLAAEHKDNVSPKSLYDQVNVQGARNICEAARKKNVNTIVFTSSVAVYGFAPANTDEDGEFAPFNDYGRTKMEAEVVYKAWQKESPDERSLIIIRPTVVFGERNRGNVYNLLKQLASGRFFMVGNGKNVKSMAYVENVAAFLLHSLSFSAGVHIFNYVDKPDLDMNRLVSMVNKKMGRNTSLNIRLPYWLGFLGGLSFDLLHFLTGKEFPVSSIRVKKFCATTQFASEKKLSTGFIPEISIEEAINRTVEFEFLKQNKKDTVVFESE